MTRTGSGEATQSKMDPPNKPVEMKVVAKGDAGSLRYELQPVGGYEHFLEGQTVKLPKGPDWYEINFHLVDNSSLKLEFDQKEPICAQVGSGCPAPGSGNQSERQLEQKGVGAKRLVMVNVNTDPPRKIAYTLCFIDAATQEPVTPFDPIMDNGGGGRIPSYW